MTDTLDLGLTEEELHLLLENIDALSEHELVAINRQLEELERRKEQSAAQDDLLEFCKRMQPDYKVGRHHRVLADQLMALERGEKDRACVNMPPRHGKSQLVSVYYPAWFLGRNPDKKVMMVSHTTDLAVDFGRKVRNIIGSSDFREIFPDVGLATDSKSAGRWNTTQGGEYFACILPDTPIHTQRGVVHAKDVTPGDKVLSHSGFVPVYSTMRTSHDETFHIAGAGYSAEHPIWTVNRGWVEAGSILPFDVLITVSILDIVKASLWRAYNGVMEHPYVSALVQHKEPLHEPSKREVSKLRRAWDHLGRAVAQLRSVLSGYGRPALAEAHCWSEGQRRSVQPRKLPLGERRAATEQQAHFREDWHAYVGAACTTVGIDPRGVAVSDVSRARRVELDEETQSQNGSAGAPVDLGWMRRQTARLLDSCSRGYACRAPGHRAKKHMAGLRGAANKLLGVLLGVRYAGVSRVNTHEAREFVNFRVGGDNTFFSGGILTHNCGVGSALAGRGAHLLLIDDPHSEQDVLSGNFSVFEKAYEWFTYGARTRLMPGGRVAIVQTRWAMQDLTGRVIEDMAKNEDADQYEVVELPAILEVDNKDGTFTEKALWPEFFDLPALKRTKASMPVFQWNAQYQQNPTSEEAAVIKREWWNIWADEKPPQCEFIISTLDAAAETNTRADFTALTTWGVFLNEENGNHELILLDSIKRRLEFPELKQLCLDHYKDWEPDAFVVEKKSAGTAIYQELRRTGIPVQEYTPHRGTGDKLARLNSVSDIIASGMAWVPATRWAEELVEEVAAFPFGSHDDLVDATTMALMRFRQGGFIRLASDEADDDYDTLPRRAAYY